MTVKDACIVTDASAQFPKPIFPGSNLLTIVPFKYGCDEKTVRDPDAVKVNELPEIVPENLYPLLSPPDVITLRNIFIQLSQQYRTIFAIFLSNQVCGVYSNALEAAETLKGKIDIQVIDSMTTSVGLGLLIQKVIESILAGNDADEIHMKIRNMIPRLYTLICTPSLSYLHRNRFLEKTQSIISEMLGIIPIYTFEEGRLTPIEKVNSMHQAYSFYQEFLEEFENIEHIAFIQSIKPNFNDIKTFSDFIFTTFPDAAFSKNLINVPMSLLFGPQSNSLIILEGGLR